MNGNGSKGWDYLFKAISVIVLPWAGYITLNVVEIRETVARNDERLVSYNRRLDTCRDDIEGMQRDLADPESRFFRNDGDLLEGRVAALENLHPRGSKQ